MTTPYCTIADLHARIDAAELVQLTDDAGSGVADVARMQLAIDQATNEIRGYVAARYRDVDDETPKPPLLTDIAIDIARYRLVRHGSPTEHVSNLYKAAIARLRDIASGLVKLDGGAEAHVERDGMVLVESSDRLFTRDSMQGG